MSLRIAAIEGDGIGKQVVRVAGAAARVEQQVAAYG